MNALWALRSALWRNRATTVWTKLRRPKGGCTEYQAGPWPPILVDRAALIADLTSRVGHAPSIAAAMLHLALPDARTDAASDARRLLDEGYRPRRDTPPWPLQTPIDWDADPFNDRNWRTQLNSLRLLDPLISAHEARAAGAFLESALALALDWHQFHATGERDHPFAWRDMMVGIRSLRLAYLADRVRSGELAVSVGQREGLAEALLVHWQRLTAPGFFRYTNHTIWDLHGLAAIVRIVLSEADPDRRVWMLAIGRHLDHLVERQFDEHGVHRENSPQYHFVVSTMFRVLEASGWYEDLSVLLRPRLAAARELDGWMRLPDKRHLSIGDSDATPPGPKVRVPAASADAQGDRVELLDRSHYCFVRRRSADRASRWSFLGIKAGFDGVGHKHQDDLSYLWAESGCDIVIDPGKYSYDLNPMREYFQSNRAHNLIEFGAQENDHRANHRTGRIVRSCERTTWGYRVVTRMRHKPVNVEHERVFHFAPGRWLLVVDRFAALRPISFTHWTHLAPELSLDGSGNSMVARHRVGGEVRILSIATVPVQTDVIAGQKAPRIQGWMSRRYRVAESCPTIGLSGCAARAGIAFALSIDPTARLTQRPGERLGWSCADVEFIVDVSPLKAG